MKKLLLITLISSGIGFFYYYYNKTVEEKEEKDKEKVDIRWNDEIIYIDDLDNYFDNDIVYSGQLIIYEEPVPIYELYKRNYK